MTESIAQEYIHRGKQEGMQKSRQARGTEIARTMYHAGEPIESAARWTGLSKASIRSL